jgi:hypothetical protein
MYEVIYEYKLYSWKWTKSPKYIEFYNKFCVTLPSDPPNFTISEF